MQKNELQLFVLDCPNPDCKEKISSYEDRCPKCGHLVIEEIIKSNKKLVQLKLDRERAIRFLIFFVPLALVGWWILAHFSLEGATCLLILGLLMFHIVNLVLFGWPWKILKWILSGRW